MSSQQAAGSGGENPSYGEFQVICLCAQWCGTCREYQPGFDALAAEFSDTRFRWIDIEDEADELGDLDIENFPTVLILRSDSVLFFGTMPPQLGHLRRMIASLHAQTPEHSTASSDPERRGWQDNPDLRRLGRRSPRAP